MQSPSQINAVYWYPDFSAGWLVAAGHIMDVDPVYLFYRDKFHRIKLVLTEERAVLI